MNIYDEYFGCRYDIDGDIYEITAIYPENNKLTLSNVNDDTYINCKIDVFDFDNSI